MKIKQYGCGAMALVFLLLGACSTSTDPADAYKGESAEQIFQRGEEALRDNSYGDAIKRFEALDVQYPFGRNAEIAQLHIIYAYFENSDYLSAEAAADRFIHAHPASAHVDYAYFMRGLANYNQNLGLFERLFTVDLATRDLNQVKKSFADFSELVARFPHSVYAPAAHQYMVYLRNQLANHQLEVAQYYFNHQAYVAAANRASVVVRHYQGAPAVPEALVVMAKSYRLLHATASANEVITVLRYNYPNSAYLQAATAESVQNSAPMPAMEKPVAPKPADVTPPKQLSEATLGRVYQPNGNRNADATTLGTLTEKMKDSVLFAYHPKKGAQPEQPTAQPVMAAAAPSAAQPAAASSNNAYPFPANGAR